MEEQILSEYDNLGFFKLGNEVFYPIWAALEIVSKCHSSNIAVIGIEGFIYEETVAMQMDLIADYSANHDQLWSDYQTLCNQSAKKFLTRIDAIKDKTMVVALTLLAQEEWRWPNITRFG